jgi:hypothetical protein
MTRPAKQPFASLPGLPAADDPELLALMHGVGQLSRDGAETVIRNLLRSALGHERTGDGGYLTCLAEDSLFTFRLRSDPQREGQFEDKPAKPARAEDLEDLEAVLARHGMT